MAKNFVDLSLPDDFDGTVRLFPLKNVVLFPGVVQAFNIFEPRYREMMQDCLDSDQLLTIATVDSLSDVLPSGEPAIEPIVCVGRVLNSTKLDNGNFNLLLIGVRRAMVLTELDTHLPYRLAEVKIQNEDLTEQFSGGVSREMIFSKLSELLQHASGINDQVVNQFDEKDLPLCRLVDMVCCASGMTSDNQYRILSTLDLNHRARLLLSLLEQRIQGIRQDNDLGPGFPPKFSLN